MEERCKSCKHFYESQDEYHWCHMCAMEHDCYTPIDDVDSLRSDLKETIIMKCLKCEHFKIQN